MSQTGKISGLSTMSSALPDAVNYHAWILELILPELGKRVLEIGPGNGQYTKALITETEYLLAADIDQECIVNLAKELPEAEGLTADLESSDWVEAVCGAGCGKERFDTVLALNVLEHIKDDAAAFTRIHDVLLPGGRLLLLVPAHFALYGEMDRLAGHWRRYNKRQLRQKLNAAGLEPQKLEYINPIGAAGWWVNALFHKPPSLSSWAVNRQILWFDKYAVRLSRTLTPLTKAFFGQSLWCSAIRW
jgi:SAM-dependent methyltransferase